MDANNSDNKEPISIKNGAKKGKVGQLEKSAGSKDTSLRTKEIEPIPLFRSFRLVILLMTLLFIMLMPGAMFQSLNFGISCMVNRSSEAMTVSDNSTEVKVSNCQPSTSSLGRNVNESMASSNGDSKYQGPFQWDKGIQSNLLAAYSYGAIVIVYFSGWICDKFGTKRVMVISCAVSCVSAFLLPMSAIYGDWIAVFIDRIFLGLACGCCWPVIGHVSGTWSGPNEKSVFMAIAGTGFGAGTFVFNTISGYVCVSFGWEWIFYYSATVNAVYFIFLCIFFSSEPSESRWISQKELDYIVHGEGASHSQNNAKANRKTPWKQLMTSPAVLVTIICGFCQFTVQFFIGIMQPTYLTEAFGVDPQKVGIYSALTNLAQVIGRLSAGFIAEYIKPFGPNRETWNAKLYNTIAFATVCICFLVVTMLHCGQDLLATLLMAFQFCVGSLVIAGYMRTILFIAPRYIGQIMGLSNVGAYCAAITLPYLTSALTPHGTIAEWNNALYFVTGMTGLGLISFGLLGSAEKQSWADGGEESLASNNNNSNNNNSATNHHDKEGLKLSDLKTDIET